MLLWSVMNFYLTQFRGRALYFADFRSIKTAAAVAGGYSYAPSFRMLISVVFLLSATMLCMISLYRTKHCSHIIKPVVRYCSGGVITAVFAVLLAIGVPTSIGLTDNVFSHSTHYMYSFFISISSAKTVAPEGYSPDALEQISAQYASASASDVSADAPNVIVVMNEAFADIGAVGEINTNIEVMPFINSLTENTIRGYTYSSVYGGNTANSEFEFLTGDTMAFIPNGFMPYTTYIRSECPTIVSAFDKLGYTTVAMHPHLGGNWNRTSIYKHFGFDRALFLDDFTDINILRNCVDDRSNYSNVIRLFEQKAEGEKLFVFNITMQNDRPRRQRGDVRCRQSLSVADTRKRPRRAGACQLL